MESTISTHYFDLLKESYRSEHIPALTSFSSILSDLRVSAKIGACIGTVQKIIAVDSHDSVAVLHDGSACIEVAFHSAICVEGFVEPNAIFFLRDVSAIVYSPNLPALVVAPRNVFLVWNAAGGPLFASPHLTQHDLVTGPQWNPEDPGAEIDQPLGRRRPPAGRRAQRARSQQPLAFSGSPEAVRSDDFDVPVVVEPVSDRAAESVVRDLDPDELQF